MSQCVVYGLLSTRTNEIRYIGQTTRSPNRRLSQHLTYAKKRRTAVQLWIFREVADGFQIRMSILVADAIFNDSEINEITKWRESGARLLNHTEGGGGVLGHVQTEETKRKKSALAKLYWDSQVERVRWHPTDEQKLKISIAAKGRIRNVGRKHSEETKQKMREWAAKNREFLCKRNKGRKHSDESISKMAESRRLYWARKNSEMDVQNAES